MFGKDIKMKKIISLLLMLTMLPIVAVKAETNEAVASAVFTTSGADVKGMTVTTGVENSFDAETIDGKECWRLGVSETENCFIDINITDHAESQYENYRMDVTYLDKGHGHLATRYASYDGGLAGVKNVIKLENSGEWKTASIPLMRTNLGNVFASEVGGYCAIRLFSYDLWGYEYSQDPVYVSDVKVYDLGTEDKAKISLTSYGMAHAFVDGDKQNISYSVQNLMSDAKLQGNVIVSVIDEDNNTIWSKTDEISIAKNRTKIVDTVLNVKKYGVHTLKIEVVDTTNNLYSMTTGEISLSRKNTTKKEGFGVSSHFGWSDSMGQTMPLFTNMGTSLMRDELKWETYEKEKGVYKLTDGWNNYINKAVEAGVEPLIILDFGNELYTETTGTMPTTDAELEAFGNYVYHLVSDLKGRVKYFEVWNEPNLAGVETGVQYAKLLKVAYTRAKEANPDAKIVGLVMAGVSSTFMEYMLREDSNIFNYMDIVSFHEYTYGKPPENSKYVSVIEYCTNTLKQYCGADKEIWLTEMGLSEHEIGITEKEAAMYGVRSVIWNDATNSYKNIFYYTWVNGSGAPAYREANFGLLNSDYSAKKGYVAYSAMTHFLGGATFESRNIDSNKNHIFKYADGNKTKVYTLFNAEDAKSSVTIVPDFGAYEVYDMYGNKIESGETDLLTVKTSGAPIYVVTSLNGAHMQYDTNTVNLIGEIEGAKAGEQAMVYVLKPGNDKQDIFAADSLCYIDQITIAKGGVFEYSFPLDGEAGTYKIYIGYSKNVGLTEAIDLTVKRDVSGKVGVYFGENKVENLADISSLGAEKLTVKADIDNRFNSGITAGLYAAGYNAGQMIWCEMLNQKARVSQSDVVSFDLGIASFDGVDKVKVFLWADNQKPIATADIID